METLIVLNYYIQQILINYQDLKMSLDDEIDSQ